MVKPHSQLVWQFARGSSRLPAGTSLFYPYEMGSSHDNVPPSSNHTEAILSVGVVHLFT